SRNSVSARALEAEALDRGADLVGIERTAPAGFVDRRPPRDVPAPRRPIGGLLPAHHDIAFSESRDRGAVLVAAIVLLAVPCRDVLADAHDHAFGALHALESGVGLRAHRLAHFRAEAGIVEEGPAADAVGRVLAGPGLKPGEIRRRRAARRRKRHA